MAHTHPKIHSIEVAPGDENHTATIRNLACKDKMIERYDPNVGTTWENFTRAVEKYSAAPFHGRRIQDKKYPNGGPFQWQTYGQIYKKVLDFGSGLVEYMEPDADRSMKLCGIMGINCSEWGIADLAVAGFGGTTVPIYTTTGKENLSFVLNQNECAVVVCDKDAMYKLLVSKPDIPTLKTLIVWGLVNDGHLEEIYIQAGKPPGIRCIRFEAVGENGRKNSKDPIPPTPDTIFSFVFTSGSTGVPKAALVSHRAIVAASTATLLLMENWQQGFVLVPGGEVHLSYLPQAHILERQIQLNVIQFGGCMGFSQGKRELLLDDLKTLRPTVFPSVPRLLNLIHDKIFATMREKGGIGLVVFKKALKSKIEGLKKGKMRGGNLKKGKKKEKNELILF